MDNITKALQMANTLDRLCESKEEVFGNYDLFCAFSDNLNEAMEPSIHGLEADLKKEMERIEDRAFEEHDYAWSSGRGGTDPDAYVEHWLIEHVGNEQEAFCEKWIKQVGSVFVSLTAVAYGDTFACART
jgi:hypothetical protein